MTLPIHHDDAGIARPLGQVPPSEEQRRAVPITGIGTMTLPEAAWRPFELIGAPIRIKDQDGRGACNGHAAATSLEWGRWIAGEDHVELSAWFVYAILCRGIDRGSNIGDALSLLSATGTCPESALPYGIINPALISPAARAVAGRFKVEIGAPLAGFAGLMTATQLRRPGNFSICVGPNFSSLDAAGCPGYTPGPGNHAVTFGLGAKRVADGTWRIKCQNSWGTGWGLGGFFWIAPHHVDGQPQFEGYDVEAVTSDSFDPIRPPGVA